MKEIKWSIASFDELTLRSWYEISVLRQEVFVVEQNAAYLDSDGLDYVSMHFFGMDADKVVAYCRLIPPGYKYEEGSLGRVVVAPHQRGKQYGHKLVQLALGYQKEHWDSSANRISAQSYLIPFYASYGFEKLGEEYLEDGLPHYEMFKKQ
jgi:ElaA protein